MGKPIEGKYVRMILHEGKEEYFEVSFRKMEGLCKEKSETGEMGAGRWLVCGRL